MELSTACFGTDNATSHEVGLFALPRYSLVIIGLVLRMLTRTTQQSDLVALSRRLRPCPRYLEAHDMFGISRQRLGPHYPSHSMLTTFYADWRVRDNE